MVKIFRRFQQPLMILVTILVIVSFTWFYSRSDFMDRGSAMRVGTIYGKTFSQTQFMRESRKYDIAQSLAPDLWQTLIQPATSQDEAMNNFIWNSVVLRHEADSLGIRPTDEEIEESIKKLPFFQTNGVYDSTKYNQVVANLGSRGMTADVLEEILGDEARLKRLKTLLGSTVAVLPEEVHALFEQRNSKDQCSVVRFNFDDFLKAQQVSDEDLKKAYEERKSTLKTDELRKVKFVSFAVENTAAPLAGKERVDAFAKLSDKAQEFMVAMAEPNAKFEEVAMKLGAPVKETPDFSEEQPPAELDKSEKATEAAFKLTKDQPVSDAVQTDKGYLLLDLVDIMPAREKTFDEAKTALLDSLKSERSQEAMTLNATEVRNKIEADLKSGKTLADAAIAAGVKVEAFPPFSQAEPPFKEKDGQEVAMAARDLQPGQLSSFVSTMGTGAAPGGGILVYLDQKLPVDEKAFESSKSELANSVLQRSEYGIFRQWFQTRRAAANVSLVHPTSS